MQSYYDITNPDAAYEWLYSVLDMGLMDCPIIIYISAKQESIDLMVIKYFSAYAV